MSTPRYLVTGGAGFIGSNLVAALTAAGERVRVLDNLSTGRWEHLDGIPQQTLIERIEGDIRDAAAVARASEGIEVVFHEAALGSVPRSVETPIESDAVNLGGTVTVLDVARHQGVRRVIFAASSAAYGETPALPKHEDMAPMPLSPYAVTKLGCEQYLKVFADLYNLETLNLRYFNVFGPNQTPDGAYAAAIPRFLDAAITGRPIQIYGDGEQTRDFVFVRDTADAAVRLYAAPEARGRVVNVASGREVSVNELVRIMLELLGSDVDVVHVEARPGDVRRHLASIDLARELIGFEPVTSLRDGLAETVAWYLAERKGR
jgi:nucleoside-diphosphate-sugar epimerase